jgi:hypothetical protein
MKDGGGGSGGVAKMSFAVAEIAPESNCDRNQPYSIQRTGNTSP